MKKLMFGMILCVLMALMLLPVTAADDCGDTNAFTDGDGTEIDPWKISSAEQLNHVREHLDESDKYYKLTTNIDLNADPYNIGEGWVPIGDDATPFTGTFDGDGHVVTGLFISRPGTNFVGLFGYVDVGSEVKNLGVSGNIYADDWVGGVVGFNNGVIEGCYSNCTVTGANNVGGVAGWNDGRIQNCYNVGTVTGTGNNVGGVAGQTHENATITYCYNVGTVTGESIIDPKVGGVVGHNDNGTIEDCYWNIATSGQQNGVGGGDPIDDDYGKDTSYMTSQDFVDELNANSLSTWIFDITGNKQSGLPYLTNLGPAVVHTVTVSEIYDNDGTLIGDTVMRFAAPGSKVTLTLDHGKKAGHTIDSWEFEPAVDDFDGISSFTMPNEDVIITAMWTEVEVIPNPIPKPQESEEEEEEEGETKPVEPDSEPDEPEPEPDEVEPKPDPVPVTIIVPSNTTTIIIDNYRTESPELYEFFTPSEKKEPLKPNLWENPFEDVSVDNWFYGDVKYVTKKGLFEGTSATTFSPDKTMTYGMVLTVLGRMAKIDVADYGGDGAKYHEPYVKWARENGLLDDIIDFDPDKDITREDLAVLLYNYAKLMGLTLPETNDAITFSDESEISEYAKPAVKAMQQAGIINGRTGGNFDPQGKATRAEVAAIFRRFCETIK